MLFFSTEYSVDVFFFKRTMSSMAVISSRLDVFNWLQFAFNYIETFFLAIYVSKCNAIQCNHFFSLTIYHPIFICIFFCRIVQWGVGCFPAQSLITFCPMMRDRW